MKKFILSLTICFSVLKIASQNEASNWYFGENAGINFNIITGEVTSLNDGQINTREGCTSISDSNGQLLFYTDGTTVYNRFHDVMANGNDLLGDESSTQSAIVVPKPNDTNIYYIFTVGSNQTNTGLNYSVVDVSANLGEGAVTNKNINLLSQCAEKISAVVKDCDTKSIWVIAFANSSGIGTGNFNTFFAYEINDLGVNTTAVRSTQSFSVSDPRGYLKLSPDGAKLACANVQSGLYLFDFDSDSGRVSNLQPIGINDQINKPYGVEFSPNSNLLYVTASNDYFNTTDSSANNDPDNHDSLLLQFDLTSANIAGSMTILDRRKLFRGALQLGPNGKIYRALSETYNSGSRGLGVINNPDELGRNAFYEHNAISLAKNSTQGLPPFIASFFNKQIDIIRNGQSSSYLPLCEGESYTLVADQILGATYTWTRDRVLLPETDFDLVVTQTGTYKVVIDPPGTVGSKDCGLPQGEATIEFFNYPTANDASLFQCDLDLSTPGITTFNLTEAYALITDNLSEDFTITFHADAMDATNGTNSLDNIALYENAVPMELLHVRVTHDISGCFETSTLTLNVSNTQVDKYIAEPECDEYESPDGINLFALRPYTSDIIEYLGLPLVDTRVQFYPTLNDALLESNEIAEFTNTIPYAQTIYYRIETINNNECFGINELELSVRQLPNVIENDTFFYCLNKFPETISIDAAVQGDSPNNYSYNWSNGTTSYEIDINMPGTYTVDVSDSNGCSIRRTIIVESQDLATFSSPPFKVQDLSTNNSIEVFINETNVDDYQFALYDENNIEIYRDFQNSNVFENVASGIYTVNVKTVKNDCGVTTLPISVIGFPRFFTPNNDGFNDTWQVNGVSNLFQPNSKIIIFNRFGKLIKEISPIGNGWDGFFNGQLLPEDDYWFSATLQDGRIFKSHFTLKR